MSRASEPLIPALTTTRQAMTSWTGVDDEGAADDVAVPAGELEAVTAPRRFEQITMTLPSWVCAARHASSSQFNRNRLSVR